jgi:DNA-binding NtrC family response regulator
MAIFMEMIPPRTNMKAKVLVIEDDAVDAAMLKSVLSDEGYDLTLSLRGDDGLELARSQPFDVVVTDMRLPGLDGMVLVAQLHAAKPKLPIILITAYGTTTTSIEATKRGAWHVLHKPLEADELRAMLSLAVANSRLMSESLGFGDAQTDLPAMIGSSRAMLAVYEEIGRVAATPATVLIRGATGTGKELIARAIFHHSNRADKPFVAVNCAAIPDTLLESELFGHERGAFTGAQARRIGRFEQASGGTIFLDEIGDLSIVTQSKLLRVLQEHCIQRLGSEADIPVDVRVLAATNRDLDAAIKDKEFREDLFYRLSVVTIFLPPLSQRTEDIPALAKHFIRRYSKEFGFEAPAVQPEALAFLQDQPWPGNVRQLENVVSRTLLLARPFAISLEHVQQATARNRQIADEFKPHRACIADILARAQRGEIDDAYACMIATLEPKLFKQAILLARGNQAKAARWLGITRLKMRHKLTELGLHPAQEHPTQ